MRRQIFSFTQVLRKLFTVFITVAANITPNLVKVQLQDVEVPSLFAKLFIRVFQQLT